MREGTLNPCSQMIWEPPVLERLLGNSWMDMAIWQLEWLLGERFGRSKKKRESDFIEIRKRSCCDHNYDHDPRLKQKKRSTEVFSQQGNEWASQTHVCDAREFRGLLFFAETLFSKTTLEFVNLQFCFKPHCSTVPSVIPTYQLYNF